MALSCVYLGEHTVKNIAKPLRVYRVLLDGETPRATEHPAGGMKTRGYGKRCAVLSMTLGLLLLVGGAIAAWCLPWPPPVVAPLVEPDKPAIVVLPFVNLSHDPQQEQVSDGITEDLITALSKHSGLLVMARTSAFAYKDQAVTVRQVGQELGIRYVLEGSTRTAGNTVRITAQLVDATTGYHLWAERYDHALSDLLVLQDEIIQQIVTALQVRLTVHSPALTPAAS